MRSSVSSMPPSSVVSKNRGTAPPVSWAADKLCRCGLIELIQLRSGLLGLGHAGAAVIIGEEGKWPRIILDVGGVGYDAGLGIPAVQIEAGRFHDERPRGFRPKLELHLMGNGRR